LAGLSGMKILDDDFDQYEPQLFQKDKLHMNRAMLGKEEAESLNEQIVTMIMRLSPYFHHQCCRQVLEWLIHKYQVYLFAYIRYLMFVNKQVHTYNAETLFLAFLPYHNSNTFGRLIHILKFNSPDMDWLTEYQKDASPIPLNILCKQLNLKIVSIP
jgi:U3 small nucleolar RNA-associated protein 10